MCQMEKLFAALTDPVEETISGLFSKPAREFSDVIVQRFNYPITIGTIQLLKDGAWINDEVVNSFMGLLNEYQEINSALISSASRCYFSNSFFYSKMRDQNGEYCYDGVKKWMKSVDLPKYGKFLFPINIENRHWALTVLDMDNKTITFYDSLNDYYTFMDMGIFNSWLRDELKMTSQEFKDYQVVNYTSCPQQLNCCDCGVFMLAFALLINLNLAVELMNQKSAYFVRRQIAASIIEGSLPV